MMKFIFGMQRKTEVFYKLILSFLGVCKVRHAQSTQNKKFAISLLNLKENVKDGVDLLPADKHQRLFQVDTIILGVCGHGMPELTKITSLLFLCNVLRKK